MNVYPDDASPKLAAYVIGFMLALLLTLLAFGLVIEAPAEIPHWQIVAGVSVLAILQILVHLRYFLHLSFDPRQRLKLIALLFALFIIVIMVGGTLWIMHDMNYQMLPTLR